MRKQEIKHNTKDYILLFWRIHFFQNEHFTQAFNMPVHVNLRQPMYIEVALETNDRELKVLAETCKATPTNNPNDPISYVFLRDG